MRPWARPSCPSVSLILKETNPESSQGTEGAQDLGGGWEGWAVAKVEQLSLGKEPQRTKTQERGLLSFWGLAVPPQGSSGVPHSHLRLTPLCSPPCQPVHLAQVSFVIPAFDSDFTLDLELNQ